MSKLNRRMAMKRAAAAGMAASASTMVAGTVRAEGNQESAQPGAATQEKQSAILANTDVPMSIFVRGRQQLQLTGGKSAPGAPMWCAKADDSRGIAYSFAAFAARFNGNAFAEASGRELNVIPVREDCGPVGPNSSITQGKHGLSIIGCMPIRSNRHGRGPSARR